MNTPIYILNQITGLDAQTTWSDDMPDGETLTTEQQRTIQPLLDNGIPDVIDAAAVDFEASRRILALAPEYLQRNATARSVELTEKIAEGGTLTAEEEAERTAMRGLWATVKAIRVASNTIKAGTLPSDYSALVDAFNSELS